MRVRENRGKEVEGKLAMLEKREKVLRVKGGRDREVSSGVES
jgi:hypothetical protein